MRFLIFLMLLIGIAYGQNGYYLGAQGLSCNQVCFNLGMNCNPHIVTGNTSNLFTQLNVTCTPDTTPWNYEDQPCLSAGKCVGYVGVPGGVQCSGSNPTTSRLCRCDPPASYPTFGTGYSNGFIDLQEKWLFEKVLSPGDVGVITHFWITYNSAGDNGVIIRYYIDGEKNASITFTPSLACGVGYYDTTAPWGTQWFGKGAHDAGWFNNFRIPFQKSIVVTAQHLYARTGGFYFIIRGAVNVPINVGGITLPKCARMNQFIINGTYQALEWVPLVNVPSGPGVHWMTTISADSGNLNFLEGCFHAYFDGNTEFPGLVLSTGTEDYFDSAWYFNAGQFHLPVSGYTHMNTSAGQTMWSAYRFHDMDPLFFNNGFQLTWRIGDIDDGAGFKCMMETGDHIAGSPTPTQVLAYGWAYTWTAGCVNSVCSCPTGWIPSTVNPCNCFQVISNPSAWVPAAGACQQVDLRATLTSIDSAFENAEVLSSPTNTANNIYAQLNVNDGKWTNVDGTTNGCYVCEVKVGL